MKARGRRRPCRVATALRVCAAAFVAAWLGVLASFFASSKTTPGTQPVKDHAPKNTTTTTPPPQKTKKHVMSRCEELLRGSDGFRGMRYWGEARPPKTRPYDLRGKNAPRKFCTFEVDNGGFNNVRMAFESVAVFAHATGRTLVLPPKQRVYLLKETHAGNAKAFHGVGSFLHLASLRAAGLDIIDSEDFARFLKSSHALRLAHAAKSGEPTPRRRLREWQRLRASLTPRWDPLREVVVFGNGARDLPWRELTPTEFATAKRRIRFLDRETASTPWIHFASNASHGYRLFTHWYTFFLFMDGRTDYYYKRFGRDALRYTDDVFCAAGEAARRLGPSYSAVHVRRGELQYRSVRISGDAWSRALRKWLLPNETLFVLTDEKDRTFFEPLLQHFRLVFLDDVFSSTTFDPNKLGMVEQVVAALARTFTGTWFSTFSSYVARLRAYYGHAPDTVFYAAPSEKQFTMHDARLSLHPEFPFYTREWALAWTPGLDDYDVYDAQISSSSSSRRSLHNGSSVLTDLPPTLHYDDLPSPREAAAARRRRHQQGEEHSVVVTQNSSSLRSGANSSRSRQRRRRRRRRRRR